MMDPEFASPAHRTYGSLQSHSNSTRRVRPDLSPTTDEQLRTQPGSERLSKRESRVALRSIFGRSKAEKESDRTSSLREISRPTSIRASLADVSNWPYNLHNSRSDIYLSGPPPPSSWSTTSAHETQPSRSQLRQPRSNKIKPFAAAPITIPLFQAFPQSVKHATLPTCSAAVDALLRLNGSRNSVLLRDDPAASSSNLSLDDDEEQKGDKGKKPHHRGGGSRTGFEWVSKTYVLMTSGYLLQYAADGSFDRTPEKMLRLTKDSAAFASDLIPGKHWVLQISSSMEPDGTPGTETKSLFSKLALRGTGRRTVSHLLMVFESAEQMDVWLVTLRREIEALGGKKRLTETGNPKTEDDDVQQRAQVIQRTPVVRDPKRFSNIVRQDFSWSNENALKDHGDRSGRVPSSELPPEFALDDVSTTESHSSDSQHLESLRDSGNRLSFISSGQRTFVTSTGSSPACSPIRASFSSYPDDPQIPIQTQTLPQIKETQPPIRPRPNAQEIVNRRQSVQNLNFDARLDSIRPRPIIPNLADQNEQCPPIPPRQSIPNFSKRFSVSKLTPLDTTPNQAQAPEKQDVSLKATRKSPPTALAMSRPLSIVVDQPSPISPRVPKDTLIDATEAQNRDLANDAPDTPSMFSSWIQSVATTPLEEREEALPLQGGRRIDRQQSVANLQPPPQLALRRFVSMSGMRNRTEYSPESNANYSTLASCIPQPPMSHSMMGNYNTDNRLSLTVTSFPSNKRASYLAEHSFRSNQWGSYNEEKTPPLPQKSWKLQASSPVMSSSQLLAVDVQGKRLAGRKSMPELVEGPPLLPPPNRALPPLPKRPQGTMSMSRRSMRA